MRVRYLIVLVIALSCGASACTIRPSEGTGTEPTRHTYPLPTRTTASRVLPPITSPLDATTYKAKPCELVTKEQTATYALNHAVPSHGGDHFQDCLWEGLENSQFELMWLRFYYDTDWLARIYRNEAEPYFDDWVPLTVAGRPAARQGTPIRNDQPTKTENCRVAVALAENQAIDVSIVSVDSSCDRAATVAEAIVHNLGG